MTREKVADLIATLEEAQALWNGKPRRTGDGNKRLRAAIDMLKDMLGDRHWA